MEDFDEASIPPISLPYGMPDCSIVVQLEIASLSAEVVKLYGECYRRSISISERDELIELFTHEAQLLHKTIHIRS